MRTATAGRLVWAALVVVAVVSAGVVRADELVDDFENAARWPVWSFVAGPDCPGARGDLERVTGAGHGGSTAARLRFDFTDGGCLVGARRSLLDLGAVRGISFWLAGAVPGTRLFVRLSDETGQVFESYLPMQSADPARWVPYTVLAASGGKWWGGAADGVFHGDATQLEIVLRIGYGVHLEGAVLFDDVSALSAASVAVDPRGPGIPLPAPGRLRDRIGVNVNLASLDGERLDRAAAAGFGWIRADLDWATVERSRGHYDFTAYDALLDAVEARGMRALLVLDYFNPVYCPDAACDPHTGPATERQRSAFAAFAAAAAARYRGRAIAFEVWNEPNSTSFWRPGPDPAAYGKLAAAVAGAIGAADPGIPVAVGATAGVDVEFLDSALESSGLSGAGWVSVHPYRSFVPESIGEDVALLRETVAARTGRTDIPVVSSEWGYTTRLFEGDRAEVLHRQAVAAVRELLAAQRAGLPLAVWYDLTDDCADLTEWECNFGLLEADGRTPTPAWEAVATMSRILPAGVAEVSSCGRPPAVYCLAFRSALGGTAVLWTGQEGTALGVRLPSRVGLEVHDLFGREVAAPGDDGLELDEAKGPVYLSLPVAGRARRPEGRVVPSAKGTPVRAVSRPASLRRSAAP
ncbi:MAG: cellulase family glycosylhydrolase [Acidobacteria bacterium]|nr:cellulase family glycosylhydrolase [Acidobacteriota bacterium]